MRMVYPIQIGSRDTPKELASPEEFIAKLAAEPGGTFLLGNNRSWHGGIHLGNQNGWHPDGAVRAIADGQIVAYRLTDTPVELTLPPEAHQPGDAIRVQTSPSFCLLRHSYEAKEGSQCNRLTFYSLYMHLACQSAYQGEPERWVLSGQGVNIYNAAAQGEQFSATDRLGTARHGAELQIHGQPVERSNARHESHAYQLASYSTPQSGDPQAFYVAVQHIKAERKAQPAWMTPPASKPERYTTRGNAWLRAEPSASTEGLLGLPAHSEVVVMSEPSRRVTLNGSPTELVKVEVFKAVSGPVTDSAGHPMTHATAGAQGWLAKRLLGQQLAAETSVAIVPNRVVDRSNQPITVQAGELIGHWGEGGSIRLTASGYQSNNAQKMVHIETFVASSDKAALQQCVANAGRLCGGQAYLLLEEGKSVSTFRLENNRYTEASEFGPLAAPYPIKEQDRVTQNSNKFVKVAEDEHVLLVGKSEVVSQHDWAKLGVGLFDGSQDLDGFLEKAETENQEGSAFFTALYDALVTDRNGDEQLTASDIQQTLRDPKLAYQVRHLFICHQSEWVKRRDWPRLKQELEARPKLYDYMLELNNKLAWIEDASAILGDTKPWFIHPAGMMGLVGDLKKITTCDCESLYADKFKVTRYGQNNPVYGPVYWGEMTLDSYPRWNDLIANGRITESERIILVAMSDNEGNMDSIQSYDSEVITVGAMQKTVKDEAGLEGKGELSAQLAKFRDLHIDSYESHMVNCGWSVEGSGSSAILYYSDASLTHGDKITSTNLKNLIRTGCNENTYRHFVHNKPLASLLKVITLPEYLDIQIFDFIQRLNAAENQIVSAGNIKIKDFVKSNFGRALILDHSVNRPGLVSIDFRQAIANFHQHNPTVNLDPQTWGEQHSAHESNLLEEYKSTRRMTNSIARYDELRRKF